MRALLKNFADVLKHLSSHVFATLTFSRDTGLDTAWQIANTTFNRYIQRFRRAHTGNQIQYIRTIEAHMDSYPHFHAILQFESPVTVDNARYFDNVLYRKWKQLWNVGLSDYQPPRAQRQPILYLIKYISKDTPTIKTLWHKILPIEESVPVTATVDSQPSPVTSAELYSIPKRDITLEYCKKYNIKQLTWSRKFIFPRLPKGGQGGTPEGLKY